MLQALVRNVDHSGGIQKMPALHADVREPPPSRVWWQSCKDAPEVAQVAQVAQEWSGETLIGPFVPVYGGNRDNTREALVVLHNITRRNADLVVCSSRGVCWTRADVRCFMRWAFVKLGFERLTARIRSSDAVTLGYVQRLGFKYEGRFRKFYADDVDGVCWGMTRAECQWLQPEK